MIYPDFLKEHGIIGICAPSAGVGHKIDSFNRSLALLKERGWKTWETAHVRVDDLRGGTAQERAQELMSLFSLPAVNAVFCASGGDFLSEILPLVDWRLLADHPKLLMGASDPTGLLFPMTTLCDIATVYGSNAGSFDALTTAPATGQDVLPEYLENTLRILKGEDIRQKTFPMHLGVAPFLAPEGPLCFDAPASDRSAAERLDCSGRCIGGCIDVLKDLIGTRFDHAVSFIRRYREDGIIWYFDNFALSSAVLYRTFLQMRYAGWIDPETTRAILIGRTLFETVESEMSYEEAISRAFPDIPVISEMDIGHGAPHFTMVNGAILDLHWEDRKAELHFRFE